jgi:hypothetical protein
MAVVTFPIVQVMSYAVRFVVAKVIEDQDVIYVVSTEIVNGYDPHSSSDPSGGRLENPATMKQREHLKRMRFPSRMRPW